MNSVCTLNKLVKGSLLLWYDIVRNYVLFAQDSVEVLDELHCDDFMGKLVVVFVKKIGELKV